MKELSKKKYVTLITIMILVLGIIGIVNIGNTDLDKGKVKLKSASIEKLKSSVIESKGYEEITYPVLYELEKVEGIEERNVIIKGTLTKEENKYARFKEITSKTITSTVSENGREIEIKIEKVKLGRQNKINIKIEINGAINETKIKPEIEIKEESEKEYTKVNTGEIEVKTNSVTGLVQDEEGMSVSNLELSINKGNEEIRRTYTDENGRYVFSDVEEGKYTIKVEEENYELKEVKEVEVIGGITENIIVKKIKPYEIEVKKYISKIKLNNNGKEIEYEYGKLNKVNQTVKNLKNLSGEIEYKIEIKNTGEKSGEITKIEEEVTEGLKFNKEKNSEWEEKNGKIINRNLEGIKLKAGEEKEITLKLDIEKTDEARSYLQKVTAKGEVYQNVVYILGGKEYRKEKVLEGEKIEEPKIVQENFKGWYTDKKYTNKYNFENSVTKDIILYGKVEESTKKYTVQYIDEGKIIKEEELEEGSIINAPEVTKEGYTFKGWYEGEEKYDVYEPITRNLILESKYEINKYKVRFINEDESVLQEETLDYGSTPTYKKETPTKKRTEEYTYEFDKWSPEITKVTGNQEYKATYKATKNKYTVTYINEGKEYHKETALYGNTIKNVENPTKEGYTFIGWYDINDKKVNHPITVTKNMTLYSKYEINSYKVSYYNEGVKYIEDQKINYGENALKPNTDPSKIGYTFKYWSLKENGEKYEFSTKITKDIALYAVYEINKYTVTYINEGKEYHKETTEYGSVVTSIQNPTKEGYTFIGWYDINDKKVNHPITVTKNMTLYSKYEINSYKVSYYNEGVKYIEDQKINYGENALKPNTDPSKIGYTFKYWSIKENGEEYEFSTKITEDITLYAVYEINKYTVTYINEGVEYHKETAEYGSVVISIQDPTKEGYTFIGWYNENNEKVTHPITVTENITLHSKYEINTYTVSFYHNNEKYVEDQRVNYGESALKPSIDPTKEDYNFSGWVIKGTNNKYDFTSKVTKDIELESSFTAKPTYTVTFKIGNEVILTENVIEGHKVTSKEAPYKKGYLFDKWYSDEGLTIENNFNEKIMGNKIIYGKYNENKHTVTYINEGTTYYTEEVLDRFTATGPSTNPEKEGYTFKYFSKDKKVAFDYNSEITEDTTLYAVYEINKYTVTYINEGSEYHKEELTYKSKHEKIEDPFKTGYTFTGWYNENEEKVEYPITVTKDITLHSKYEINKYTVTFNDEDRITTKEVNYNNKVEPVINQGKTGYTFKYWSKEKGGEEYNFNTLVTENTTLYAVYEINKYTVTYINEGSEYHKEELTYKSKHEKIEDPFKTGYTFTGWYNENEEKVEYPITVTKDITLHSKYEINKYTVTFNDEDRITTKEVNYNAKVEPVTNQGKTGYTFKYWSIEKGGEEYNFNEEVTENITLYAVYEINIYKVIFKNYDGSTLQEETLEYGALPKYKGEAPKREKTKEYTYTFKGWDKEITEVTNNQEYIATYTETKNKYNVKFTNYDGSILQEETLEYGTLPVYKGEVPTREKTDEYTYAFKNWNKEITEVTDNEIYIATYKETKNKYTVIYMDGEKEYTRKEVNYGETVSEEVINKDHNIYRGWTLEGNIYDFNTTVTKNITIKSSFELVESPIIESTPIEWTKENVKVTITPNYNDYSYMYKIDDGEYQNYNGEFTVDKNCTVIAKSIKENVESEVTTKEITNIDKVLPVIKEITEENITTKSFDIKVKGQDNESGLSEIRIYKNEELMVSYPYTERLNEEKEETYSLTGLEENTTYKIKVELIDKVGNINISEEKEITTLKRVIVSRIIGRNNSLYESEAEYELFESLEEAITSCGSNECTIEMVLDTKESVNVLEGQEIKLELNGKIVTGTRDYTIENSGELIITDKEEREGGIINNTDTAIKNIGSGILQIGENEEPLSVSMTKPNIVGTTYGIYTEEETSKLKFYDGKIEGNVAIQGNVDDTPYLYNAKITNEGHQVATLSILAEAEAKITGGKYYTKLSGAVSETKSGTYEESNKSILSTVKTKSRYSFDYNEEENALISNNQKQYNQSAYSYIKLDLTNYTKDQELIVTGEISTYQNYGYAIVTENTVTPTYNQTNGRVLYMTSKNETKTETGNIVLEKGKIYYLHIGYNKSSGWNNYTDNTDTFKITNITLSDYIVSSILDEETNIVTQDSYGFVYQDGVLKSNNQKQRYTTANSYIKVDLTNSNFNRKIYIDAELHATAGDYGLITINNSEDVPSYSDTNGRIFYRYGNVSSKVYAATLEAGKVSYIHFGYKKNNGYDDSIDAFIINSITYNKGEPKNPISRIPVLNEKVDTVEHIKDITLTSSMEINETKEMVLDLKGYTLTTTSNDYVIKNSGDLTIIDSKYSADQDKNQADYDAEQAKYDEEYNAELSVYNKAKTEYEKSIEEYNKKLEEYYASHPGEEFEYTGEEGTYVVPQDGTYELETWGAQGGTAVDSCDGGYGGYSYGQVELKKGDILYINVGGVGTCNVGSSSKGGYNGGGDALSRNSYRMCSGGGATHIATKSGFLKTLSDSTDSILIVSGSGGGSGSTGSSCSSKGGSGGGISGTVPTNNCSDCGTRSGGTQTSGGRSRFGTGGFGFGAGSTTSYSVGGGSGYYGGAGDTYEWGATGGSGYIGNSKLTNKKMYCYDCTESSDESTKTISTTNVSEIPAENNAKKGNGYAKITLLGSNNSDSTIEKPTKPEEPEILKTTDVELETSNFTYSGNGRFTKRSSNLNFYVNNSGNKSVTYYNKKINVTSKTYAHVNLSLYQNYYSDGGLLGTAYIGFSKTNEANIDDFVSYVEKNITSYSGKATPEDINIPIGEPGEYYFKIVLYHNSNTSSYTVYSDLYNLSFDNKPVLKKATLKQAIMTGTITSTTNSVIYNDNDANLTLRDGIFILNKAGNSSKYLDLIENDGTLNIKENANLIVNSSYNNVINNKAEGKLVTTNPTLNIKNSYSNGIYNQSKKQDSFSELKINSSNSSNTNGINTVTNKDIKISDVEIKGSYNAGIYIGNGTITINDISIALSSGIGIYNYGTLLIKNGNILSLSSGGISNLGTLTVEGGTIIGDYYAINNWNDNNDVTITIIDGTITGNTKGIYNDKGITNIKGGTVTGSTGVDNGLNGGALIVEGGIITGSTGINNNNRGIATIKGGTITSTSNSSSVSTISNSGTLTIGEKDGEASIESTTITGNNYGISNSGTFNFYDGKIIGSIGKWLNGYVSDSEDNYDINIETKENTEEVTLTLPNEKIVMLSSTKEKYSTIQEAINAASDGDIIEVLKDVKTILCNEIPENKNITIDIKGNNVKNYKKEVYIINSGTLEIKDSGQGEEGSKTYGKLENTGGTVINSNNVLNINNIVMTSNGTAIINVGTLEINNTTITSGGAAVINNEIGSITVNDVTINGTYSGIQNSNNGKVTINGGNITTTDSYGHVIKNLSSGIIEINGGKIRGNRYTYGIQNAGTGKVIINGGEIYDSSWAAIGNESGELEINGGKIQSINNSGSLTMNAGTITGGISNSQAGQATITGGNISGGYSAVSNGRNSTLTLGIKDGNVNKNDPVIIGYESGISNEGTFNFYDGIIKGRKSAISGTVTEIEEGYEIITEKQNGYEVKYLDKLPIAKLVSTNVEYTDLQEAIDASTNGETIEILRNATFISSASTFEVSEEKNITIDLKGYILTRGNSTLLNNKGSLTITDSGKGEEDSKTYGKMENTGGTVITNTGSGTLEINNTTITSGGAAIINNEIGSITVNDVTINGTYSGIQNSNNGKVTINGGNITTTDSYGHVIKNLSSGIIEINGGKIRGNRYTYGIQNAGTGKVIINGGEIYDSSWAAIGNESGELEINGGKIQSINNSGSLTMNAGTITGGISNSQAGQATITGGNISGGYSAVSNGRNSTLTLGIKDGNVNKNDPVIIGYESGISNEGTFNFYDGIIKGRKSAISGTVTEIEEGYEIITEKQNGYEVKYLDKLPIAKLVSTNVEYTDLQEAIDASTNGETIEILRNATFISSASTFEVSEEKNITIDLKGYILTRGNSTLLNNKGSLTITDSGKGEEDSKTYGKMENTGGTVITNTGSGTLEINNTTITSGSTAITNNDTGNVTINSGTITGYNGINNASTGKVIINGGNIASSGGYHDAYASAIKNTSGGTVEINGGIIRGSDSYNDGIQNTGTGKIIVRDGIISGSNEGIENSKTGTIEVDGGSIDIIRNSGTLKMTGGTVTRSVVNYGDGITTITSGTLGEFSNNGTATITGGTISSDYNGISNSGTLNVSGGSIKGNNYAITNSGGTVNIENVTLSDSNIGISNSSGTINIGSKDGNVSTEMPVITGKTYGVSNENSGKVNFYDGIVSGESGAFYGTVNEVEPGYKIVTNKTDTLTSATLTLVGDDEKVAVLNGINFTSLQDAINSASDTNESIITLYKDVTFESNITVPANKNIKLYLNGYTLNKGSYDFTGEGKITVIDGTSTNALANIMESVKEVLNIEGIKKNIIIYEMDDGSAISSESTYKLYKDNEEVILEEDAIGIYSVGNSNDEIRSANNKIYINELPKGKYKLIGDNNKEVKFEIDESGKIIGKVKENTKETRKLVSTAVAELIIMIQTGIEKVNYIMIILTLLVTISSLLYIVKKTNVKES